MLVDQNTNLKKKTFCLIVCVPDLAVLLSYPLCCVVRFWWLLSMHHHRDGAEQENVH